MTWVIVIKTALGLDFRSFGLSLKRPTFSHKLAETAGLEVGAALYNICAAGGVQLIIMLVLANKPHLSCWACLFGWLPSRLLSANCYQDEVFGPP